MIEDTNKRLGRGLSALLGEEAEDYAALDRLRASKEVPIEYLRPNPFQPRHRFDGEELEALVASVRARGILQPLLVRRVADEPNAYEIIAGERRWRAAQKARLHQVPVVIREFSDVEALEIALIENLQRQDLTPLEEADGYARLMGEFAYTQEQLAEKIGKSRSHVANMLRLRALPDEVKQMLDERKLTAGHARALVAAEDPVAFARQIVAGGFNVRQAEALKRRSSGRRSRPGPAAAQKDADTLALEADLTAALGLKVAIDHRGARGGSVRIDYQTLEQLDEVCRRLCHHSEATDLPGRATAALAEDPLETAPGEAPPPELQANDPPAHPAALDDAADDRVLAEVLGFDDDPEPDGDGAPTRIANDE